MRYGSDVSSQQMQRPVSSLALSPGVKVKLAGAGFQFTAELLQLTPAQLRAGTAAFPPNFRNTL